jgi:deazaflavin-dependent oxidoreductase (nitroreductase family)
MRLGWMFGSRLLMLEHRGRSSGRRRYVVLEVVDRPAHESWVVVAGFGERAQWLRNVRVDPRVRVWLGARGAAPALARELSGDERKAALGSYAAHHPRAWGRLRPVLEETLGVPIDAEGTNLPMVLLERVPR